MGIQRIGHYESTCRVLLLPTVLVTILMALLQAAAGQGKTLTVTVLSDKANGVVTDAQVWINEETNMIQLGHQEFNPHWVRYNEIEVTDPVIPPEGFELKPATIEWKSLRQIEFLVCEHPPYCKAKIIMNNGQTRDVYVWRDEYSGRKEGLEASHVKVSGKMSVNGQILDVEFQGDSTRPLRLIFQDYSGEVSSAEPTISGSRSQAKPSGSGSAPRSISSAIDKIEQGRHQELPPPTQTAIVPGQSPGWSIENATGYQLRLYLSGPAERDYQIANGNSITIDLPPGSYRIAADVPSKGVLPFYAVRQLDSGTRWKSHFYIASK
jgi:hypothetical protein